MFRPQRLSALSRRVKVCLIPANGIENCSGLGISSSGFKPPANLSVTTSLYPYACCRRHYSGSGSGISPWHGTTILCVRKEGKVVMIGDGQVSQGNQVVKGNSCKIRRINDILVGFAGTAADAFTLMENLERHLEEHSNQLMRACVELAKAWRTDKYLRRLEAVLLVADKNQAFELTGMGDVLDPQYNCMGVGSGGPFALAAARALMDTDLEAEEHLKVARRSMAIAADMCVFTNSNFTVEVLGLETTDEPNADQQLPSKSP